MKLKIRHILYFIPLAALTACEPEIEDVDFNHSNGTADFSSMVAIGNSLTAGFQSNALRREKQENSFPAILAEQLSKVGGGSFEQPLLSEGVGIGSSLNAEFGLRVSPDCLGEPQPSPQPISSTGQLEAFSFPAAMIGSQGPFNNYGVPGAKSYHLVAPGYGNPANVQAGLANPFYARFVNPTDPDETMLQGALSANPTFFTLWIGNNDVLGYATSGGAGVDQTGNTNVITYGSNDITDPTAFAGVFSQLVNALTGPNGEVQGAVANIPDVTDIPYFNTVKWNALEISAEQATALNMGFAAYNGAVEGNRQAGLITQYEADKRSISFSAGANALVMVDSSLTQLRDSTGAAIPGTFIRQISSNERLVLTTPSDQIKCEGFGSVNTTTNPPTPNPITPNYVLDSSEIAAVKAATTAYNNTIETIANANGLAFVDINAKMSELASGGVVENGIFYTNTFVTGGAFSLDGVHPSTRGYAIIANEFIEAINSTYSASIPKTMVSSYPTIE